MKFMVSVRIYGESEYVGAQSFLMANVLFEFFKKSCPSAACIDILDGTTGEVLKSTEVEI